MDVIRNTTEYPKFSYAPFEQYFGSARWGVFDIETTGLSPSNCSCILTGLLIPEGDHVTTVQYFADSLDDEEFLLHAVSEDLRKLDMVVTYNGRSFDLPFLSRRYARYCLEKTPEPYDLDLFSVIRKHSPLRQFMPNLKQKTVENFMGLWSSRSDLISGGDSVGMYFDWLSSGDTELKRQILLHNSDDVLQLYKLLGVLKESDLHAAMTSLGFPVAKSGCRLTAEDIKLTKNELTVKGVQNTMPFSAVDQGDETGLRYDFSAESGKFKATLRLITTRGVTFADIAALGLSETEFEKYPEEADGFLALRSDDEVLYGQMNELIIKFLERIIEKWITKKQPEK